MAQGVIPSESRGPASVRCDGHDIGASPSWWRHGSKTCVCVSEIPQCQPAPDGYVRSPFQHGCVCTVSTVSPTIRAGSWMGGGYQEPISGIGCMWNERIEQCSGKTISESHQRSQNPIKTGNSLFDRTQSIPPSPEILSPDLREHRAEGDILSIRFRHGGAHLDSCHFTGAAGAWG